LEEESGVCSDDCTAEVRVRQRVPLARVPARTPAFARFPPHFQLRLVGPNLRMQFLRTLILDGEWDRVRDCISPLEVRIPKPCAIPCRVGVCLPIMRSQVKTNAIADRDGRIRWCRLASVRASRALIS
jgi:hypothetical protein